MKEKLIDLLCQAHNKATDASAFDDATYAQQLEVEAEHLIAHGVTVQEWISVKDHTPKEKGCYLIAGNHWWDGKPVAREAFWNGDDWLSCYDKGNISRRVTHWQYLPQPPKG